MTSQVRRHRYPLIVLILLAAASTAWSVIRDRTPPPVVVPPAEITSLVTQADPVDSLLVASRGAAEYARQRAASAGAPPAQLLPGDSVRQLADSFAGLGRKAEAAVLLTTAAGLWDKAERSVRGTGAARSPSAQPTGSRASASPAETRPPVVVSDSQAIVSYYRELGRAVEARQLGEVKRLLPNLTSNDERNWRGLFDDRDVDSLNVSYIVLNVTRRDALTYARVRYTQSVTKRGRTQDKSRIINATLTLGPQGWRQIREENSN